MSSSELFSSFNSDDSSSKSFSSLFDESTSESIEDCVDEIERVSFLKNIMY